MNKLIIFGSNGMLGNYIKKYFEKKTGYDVIPIDRKKYDVMRDSLRDLEDILINNGILNNTIVVNAIGLIPPAEKKYLLTKEMYTKINSEFPKILNSLCDKYGYKMIHITTDCVFDGKKGGYIETDISDAETIYGKSKSAGESINCSIIRTSIIGEEEYNRRSLIEWVKSNMNGEVNGYINHHWNGITCLQFAKIIEQLIEKDLLWTGVRHIFSPTSVSKYELIQMINEIYDLHIKINKYESSENRNMTIDSIYNTCKTLSIPSLKEQIYELYAFSKKIIGKKISIVMSYYNRKTQIEFTLKTIAESSHKNIEVIIIDDNSSKDQQLDNIITKYDIPIKYIKIDASKKNFINPCVAYNIGFKKVTGNIVIIQNPECCHIGDIIKYVHDNLKINDYFSFSCANLKEQKLNEKLYNIYKNNDSKYDLLNFVNTITANSVWYNHPKYRPVGYHFLTAIYKVDLDKLKGFDERYAQGSSYDDDELVARIKFNKMNFQIFDPDNYPFTIHQWHLRASNLDNHQLAEKNRVIFNNHMRELGISTQY